MTVLVHAEVSSEGTRSPDHGAQASKNTARVASVPSDRKFSKTSPHARAAMEQINDLQAPADPPSFHLWYAYAAKTLPALNQALDDLRKRYSDIPIDELDRIYDRHLTPAPVADQVSRLGSELRSEIALVISGLDSAAGAAVGHARDLAGASKLIGSSADHQSLRRIVDLLQRSTQAVIRENQALQESLQSSKEEIEHLQSKLELICQESLTDPLTSLANRRQFDLELDMAINQAAQSRQPLSLLMCDIDRFKAFNDRHGHVMGDQVLRLIAQAMRLSVRGQDKTARYGGEEFAIILPSTSLLQAQSVAENVRKAIIDKKIVKRSTGEVVGQITISIGVAQFQPDDNAQSIIERADAHLYTAKHAGGNLVVTE